MFYMSWDDLASVPQLTAAKTFLIVLELFNLCSAHAHIDCNYLVHNTVPKKQTV